MPSPRSIAALLVLLACLTPTPAPASTALDLDVEGLTVRAERVVRARVVSSESRWTAGGRRIVTETRLHILEVLAGEAPSTTLRVVQPGGTVDGRVQEVIGAARFTPGEEVVVFLRPSGGRPTSRVVGMALGKYRVLRSEGAPAEVRRDDLEAVQVLHPQTHRPQGPEQARALDSLRAQVRAAGGP